MIEGYASIYKSVTISSKFIGGNSWYPPVITESDNTIHDAIIRNMRE